MKKELKGFMVGCLTTTIIGSGVAIASNQKTIDVYENNVTIEANGQLVNSPNFTYNDTTYVPLRAVLELMDCNITYDEETKTVRAYNNFLDSTSLFPFFLNGDTTHQYQSILNTETGIFYVDGSIMSAADFDVSNTEQLGFTGFMCMDNDKFVAFDTNTSSSSNNNNTSSSYGSMSHTITPSMFPLSLFSDEADPVFLGILTTDKYDSNSISNTYGDYGSKYSQYSIFNTYGDYGSKYSQYSAFNDLATHPPLICDVNGNILGRLTTNTIFIDGYTWEEISAMMKK